MPSKSRHLLLGTLLANPLGRGREKLTHHAPLRPRTGDVMENSKMKIVYVITQRNNKSYWNRVGVAFVNGDGSINVKLEAMPVNGEMQIRDYTARDDSPGAGFSRRSNGDGLESYQDAS
jgi:hypothetical protein